MVPSVSKVGDSKKGSVNANNSLSKNTIIPRKDETVSKVSKINVPPVVSPSKSDGLSVSMDESMSTCDSLNSPDVEYIDSNDIAAIESIERKTSSKLNISDHVEQTGN